MKAKTLSQSGLQTDLGTLVKSTKGRDTGNYFVIVAVISEEYVQLADGDLRKLSKPKLKKRKHLKITDVKFAAIAAKLAQGTKVFDSEIYSAIKNAVSSLQETPN